MEVDDCKDEHSVAKKRRSVFRRPTPRVIARRRTPPCSAGRYSTTANLNPVAEKDRAENHGGT